MRFIKKYNEEVKFQHEWDPECVRLQREINKYNDILLNDEVWKKFYHIDDYYKKQLDSDFLESIIEFGKKRIDEIKKENEEDLLDIKDIFEEVKDTCDEYFDSVEIERKEHDLMLDDVSIYLAFSKKCLKERRESFNKYRDVHRVWYLFNSNEIKSIWPSIIWATEKLEDMGFQVGVNYKPDLTELVFTIKKILIYKL